MICSHIAYIASCLLYVTEVLHDLPHGQEGAAVQTFSTLFHSFHLSFLRSEEKFKDQGKRLGAGICKWLAGHWGQCDCLSKRHQYGPGFHPEHRQLPD